MPGGAVYDDDLFYIGHGYNPDTQADHYLGHFLLEPKRHVPGLDGLTAVEAQQVGWLTMRLSRALKQATDAEHIYLFVMGHHVDHLHLHLFPRYPGTPRDYWGTRVDEWPDAPLGDAQSIGALCERVRHLLE